MPEASCTKTCIKLPPGQWHVFSTNLPLGPWVYQQPLNALTSLIRDLHPHNHCLSAQGPCCGTATVVKGTVLPVLWSLSGPGSSSFVGQPTSLWSQTQVLQNITHLLGKGEVGQVLQSIWSQGPRCQLKAINRIPSFTATAISFP